MTPSPTPRALLSDAAPRARALGGASADRTPSPARGEAQVGEGRGEGLARHKRLNTCSRPSSFRSRTSQPSPSPLRGSPPSPTAAPRARAVSSDLAAATPSPARREAQVGEGRGEGLSRHKRLNTGSRLSPSRSRTSQPLPSPLRGSPPSPTAAPRARALGGASADRTPLPRADRLTWTGQLAGILRPHLPLPRADRRKWERVGVRACASASPRDVCSQPSPSPLRGSPPSPTAAPRARAGWQRFGRRTSLSRAPAGASGRGSG